MATAFSCSSSSFDSQSWKTLRCVLHDIALVSHSLASRPGGTNKLSDETGRFANKTAGGARPVHCRVVRSENKTLGGSPTLTERKKNGLLDEQREAVGRGGIEATDSAASAPAGNSDGYDVHPLLC